ncbi:hypothetical protein [Methanoregula sp.]|uniref:hypothetical protein n=1 Tax=Methanoregula sp. TaxID=2052170 RepID=UPI002C802C0A|nr:hypothetical protein [Methanoregula sp.]HVP97140.1 hypothetical protein [Methanoregula sp.]
MRCGSAGSGREQALSEVIGFVLIIGIVMAAFSLYLVYGVPLQGRENEINHMNDVQDQFIAYKINVDSLWTNHQTGLAISTSFPLGTAGQTAQGSTSIIPILQPVGSSGSLAINQRTTTPEIFTISSTSYISNTSAATSVGPISIPTTQTYSNAPSSLLINLSTPNAFWNITSTGGTPGSVAITGSGWNVSVNVTPDISDCLIASSSNLNNVNVTYQSSCYGSDITVTVMKNGVTTLNRAVVYSNINPNTPYSINLLDAAYGLQSTITYPATMTFSTIGTPPLTSPTVTTQYAYKAQSNYTYSVPLGAIEYSASNNYWIPQSYYTQMGGVFLSQIDGITYKLPPEIIFVNNGNGNITVNIIVIAYDPANSGAIGGTSPAQVSTSLDSNSGSLPYAPVSPNTWNASINITTPDPNAATMWANYLNSAANQTGGIPTTYYTVGTVTNGSYIQLNGINDGNPHITLQVAAANLSANVQSAGSS